MRTARAILRRLAGQPLANEESANTQSLRSSGSALRKRLAKNGGAGAARVEEIGNGCNRIQIAPKLAGQGPGFGSGVLRASSVEVTGRALPSSDTDFGTRVGTNSTYSLYARSALPLPTNWMQLGRQSSARGKSCAFLRPFVAWSRSPRILSCTTLVFGCLLVFLIKSIFMGDLRSAIIVGSNIPFALFFATILLVMLGESANLLSVGAVDFGIIVDSRAYASVGILSTRRSGKRLSSRWFPCSAAWGARTLAPFVSIPRCPINLWTSTYSVRISGSC